MSNAYDDPWDMLNNFFCKMPQFCNENKSNQRFECVQWESNLGPQGFPPQTTVILYELCPPSTYRIFFVTPGGIKPRALWILAQSVVSCALPTWPHGNEKFSTQFCSNFGSGLKCNRRWRVKSEDTHYACHCIFCVGMSWPRSQQQLWA